jgi:hypothetical protein
VNASSADVGILICRQYTGGNIIPHNAQEFFYNARNASGRKGFQRMNDDSTF